MEHGAGDKKNTLKTGRVANSQHLCGIVPKPLPRDSVSTKSQFPSSLVIFILSKRLRQGHLAGTESRKIILVVKDNASFKPAKMSFRATHLLERDVYGLVGDAGGVLLERRGRPSEGPVALVEEGGPGRPGDDEGAPGGGAAAGRAGAVRVGGRR